MDAALLSPHILQQHPMRIGSVEYGRATATTPRFEPMVSRFRTLTSHPPPPPPVTSQFGDRHMVSLAAPKRLFIT